MADKQELQAQLNRLQIDFSQAVKNAAGDKRRDLGVKIRRLQDQLDHLPEVPDDGNEDNDQ